MNHHETIANESKSIALTNMWVAFIFFAVAAILGVYQVAERSGLFPVLESPTLYFASVSTHGVLMGFVLTTFFIMGFGYHTAVTSLKMPLWSKTFSWLGFYVALIGVLMAAYPLLTGQASVLFTFYPPLKAHPMFYIGATLLVVGSWFWCVDMLVMMDKWKKTNIGEPVPFVMFATSANAVLWLFTSLGVAAEVIFQLIPWSLGWIDTVDVGLARTLFSWTLHAIVYFWLIPAYIALYSLVPKAAGGKMFSDQLARISLVMLLVISVPIGMHHLYLDPFQAAGWKFLHMIGTLMVALPTMFTGFTVIASLEVAGRMRGGKGLFGWIKTLPWENPMVLAGGLSLLMLTFGGFGGLINASYALNLLVHNTQWITGHFHLIFGGTTIIMYFAIAYYLWPQLTGRELCSIGLVRKQLWLWFWGMLVLTLPWHWIGLLGQPRRISSTPYDSPLVEQWQLGETMMLVGGVMLLVSALMLIYILIKSSIGDRTVKNLSDSIYAEAMHPVLKLPATLNGFGFWSLIILVYLIVSYGVPIGQFFFMDTHGVPPFGV